MDYIPGKHSQSRYDVAMDYETHQRELGKQINLVRQKDPSKEWTPHELAKELAIEVGSEGYQRIIEYLAWEQREPPRRRPIGF